MPERTEAGHVVLERSIDAASDIVWHLWTDPAEFAAWYGPNGATVEVTTMDVRVGGKRLLSMQVTTPGGPMKMWFTGEFREVVAGQRLVYTDVTCDEHGAPLDDHTVTEVRVELTEDGDRTRVVLTHVGIPADSPGAAGWNMALDKLAARVS